MSFEDRRKLSRDLSALANASVAESLGMETPERSACQIVGVTGAPGAGKSTLVANLARVRLTEAGLAIIAIDPTSPVTGGAILGDRIRMSDLAEEPRIYVRSFASRTCTNGLTNNLPRIIDRLSRETFAEVLLETTGVGQVEYAIRSLVDTLILVLTPGAGDQIQAMKSGIIEIPDILVVNKADLPGSRQYAHEIQVILEQRRANRGSTLVPVLMTSAADDQGVRELSEAIDTHRSGVSVADQRERRTERRRCVIASLLSRSASELLAELDETALARPVAAVYRRVVEAMSDVPGE